MAQWFVLVVTPDKVPTVAKAIGREDILKDPRFSDPAKLAQNRPQLTSMLDEIFGSQPMSHWYEVFNGAQITFGAVRGPQEVVNDPQLRGERHRRSARRSRREVDLDHQQSDSSARHY